MDLAKFLALLQTNELWFARADTLGDPFEGSLTRPDAVTLAAAVGDNGPANHMRRRAVSNTYVSCWHMNEGESAAMWSLYSASHESVCVRTTFQALASELPDWVHLSEVRYVDYGTTSLETGGLVFQLFLHKRASFAHERELRAFFVDFFGTSEVDPSSDPHGLRLAAVKRPGGAAFKVDLNRLIDGVSINPQAPTWFADTVRRVAEVYGLASPVVQSELLGEALY
ncbi:DUF2971 domain-containing protein [Phenylobacterium terrae]|uniref:DUF2971 domain-containing protein n=1 Tax=Phenylobacterium terrae TaxID=2665495 RepID=A0ABW4N769_9CAUL